MSNKWQKGQSGNPNGRPEGSKNKSTKQIRESIQQLVENNIESIQESLDSMSPKDKMKYIIDLGNFSILRNLSRFPILIEVFL